jgi:uncharacterized membrane protein YfcA
MEILSPWFCAVAIPAVMLSGISKGGFGGGLGILSVPIMSLVISPVQAAAIMLPLLCLMDLFGIWAYRNRWDPANLRMLIPGSLAGIAAGTLLFNYLTPDFIRLLVGCIAVLFTLDYWSRNWLKRRNPARRPGILAGSIAGFVGGITSFIANAGSPPVSMYLLPQRLDRTRYVATTVFLFTVINYVKLVPYGWLGLLHIDNVTASCVLMPVAVAGMALGIWLHKHVSDAVFYSICYALLFIVGLKLVSDSLLY